MQLDRTSLLFAKERGRADAFDDKVESNIKYWAEMT